MMEFLETVAKYKSEDDVVDVHLITVEDEFKGEQQKNFLIQMQISVQPAGIRFEWEFDTSGSAHARHIVTDMAGRTVLMMTVPPCIIFPALG